MTFRHSSRLLKESSGSFFLTNFKIPQRWFRMHSLEGPPREEVFALKNELYGDLVKQNVRKEKQHPLPAITNKIVQLKRSKLFSEAKEAQKRAVGRINKIQVEYKGLPEDASLIMNKNISTPYHCAQHLGEMLALRSIVAEVNGQLWDMHRPLEHNCTLRLLHMKMKDEDCSQVNRVFWRSCSFMLGSVAEKVFKDHVYVELHSFPPPNVRTGSFVYDVDLKLKNWNPNSDEMRLLSAEMIKLSRESLPFERLEVDVDLALKMFEDNKYKREQIPEIAEASDKKSICLYRIGDFVDISKGPMMSNTNQLSKCTITASHSLEKCQDISNTLYRLQGVALPSGILLNHYAYGLIEQRGRKLNSARVPGEPLKIEDTGARQSISSA